MDAASGRPADFVNRDSFGLPGISADRAFAACWQGIVRVGDNGEPYVLVHTFYGEAPEEISIPLPERHPLVVKNVYSDEEKAISIKGNLVSLIQLREDEAVAVHFS